MTDLDPRVDRAVRLFQYLARIQQVKSQPPRTLDTYQRDGAVLWFHNTPNHPAVSSAHRGEDLDPDAPLLVIDRIPRVPPPPMGEILREWTDGAIDDPTQQPSLLEQVTRPGQLPEDLPADIAADPAQADLHRPMLVETLEDHRDVQRAYTSWEVSWQSWADDELVARPAREAYERLFSIYLAVNGNPEELELAAAVGCLRWQPEKHLPVNRHLLTYPVGVDFDDSTGQLVVRPHETADGFTVELDMLDPAAIRNPQRINEIRSDARILDAHPLNRNALGSLARRLVHCLDPSGQYQDNDQPVDYQQTAAVAFAPALILRKRSQQGLIDVFRTIEEQLRRSGEVPEGLMPLIDPNHVPDPGLSWETAKVPCWPSTTIGFSPCPSMRPS